VKELNLLRGFMLSKSGVIAVGSEVKARQSGVTLRQSGERLRHVRSGVTESQSFAFTCPLSPQGGDVLSGGDGALPDVLPGNMLLMSLIRCSYMRSNLSLHKVLT